MNRISVPVFYYFGEGAPETTHPQGPGSDVREWTV